MPHLKKVRQMPIEGPAFADSFAEKRSGKCRVIPYQEINEPLPKKTMSGGCLGRLLLLRQYPHRVFRELKIIPLDPGNRGLVGCCK